MVIRSMPPLLIIFNLLYLQYSIRLLVTSIVNLATKYTTLAFWHATAIRNSVTVAKFFYETYTSRFDYLFIARLTYSGLFSFI